MKKPVFKFPSLTTFYRMKDGNLRAGFIAGAVINRFYTRDQLKEMTVLELIEDMNKHHPRPKIGNSAE